MSKLSKRQNVRFGGLIAVMGNREPYPTILDDLCDNGFVERDAAGIWNLTERGVNEKDRLAILAGLMVEKDYIAHRPRNLEKTQSLKSEE